jgi:putative ABC transport system permease protein
MPERLDQDLTDELRDHLERRAQDLIGRGATPSEARSKARRAFGNVTRIHEESRAIKSATAVEGTWQDCRSAWRGLRRRPIFALTSVLSISLAAGTMTAVYALVSATMLRPLPVPGADRLVALSTSGPAAIASIQSGDGELFSYPLYDELQTASGDTARLALFDDPHHAEIQSPRNEGIAEDAVSEFVSPDAFDILGVQTAAGQLFSRAADHLTSPRAVVLLSYDYWTRRFAHDPAAVGQSLTVDGRPHLILGVLAQGFRGVEPGTFVDLWRPITTFDPSVFTNPAFRSFRLLGRLNAGVTRQQLVARLEPTFQHHQDVRIRTAMAALPPAEQASMRAMTLVARSGETGLSEFRHTFTRPLWVLFALAALILLLACSNVAGLVMAHASTRAAEVALRIALGAWGGRLFRQFLTEGALISVLGVAGGWPIANLLAHALVGLISTSRDPVRLDLTFDPRVVLVAGSICALTTILVGAVPAWRMLAVAPHAAMGPLGRRATGTGAGRVLVGAQVALAFCLVMTGAAFLLTLSRLTAVDVGFDSADVTVLTVANRVGPTQRPLQLQLTRDLQARVATLPSVRASATAWWAMFTGARRLQRVAIPGGPISDQAEVLYRVSPRYLDTLKVPLLSGRDLEWRDNDDEPVPTLINLAFARKYFGTDAPLGRTFKRDDGVQHKVVGVTGDSRYGALRGGPEPIAYMPMKPPNVFTLYVRSSLAPSIVAGLVAREAGALGFGMRVTGVTTLRTLIDDSIVTERVLAGVGAACALLGLTLAAVGLFGLLSYSVTLRTREIGVRTALGARRFAIYGLLLGQVGSPVAVGVAVGMAASLAAIHASRVLLFGVAAIDPIVIGVALCVFLCVAVGACVLPARRAAGVDPLISLRHD